MIKKKWLISAVESLEGFNNSKIKIKLEQYTTDAISTVDFIYFIGVDNQDIIGNIIIDIGAGTGRLGLTALLFGALSLVAIEKDKDAIEILKTNAKQFDLLEKILIIEGDVEEISKNETKIKEISEKITDFHKDFISNNANPSKIVIMNPPFGIHKKGADRSFLQLSTFLSEKIYSIHFSNEKNRIFIKKFMKERGFLIDSIHSQKLFIKGTYNFHKKNQKQIISNIYKFSKNSNE